MGGVQDTMNVSAVRRAFVVLLLLTTVLGFRPGTAAACSCAILDPIDAIETSDLVFTGSKVGTADAGGGAGWRIEVDGVVKGDVDPVVDVLDRGARECGSSLDDVSSPLVVFANERDDDVVAFGCMPQLPVSAFVALSTEFSDPSGVGPPAALAVGRRGFADVRVLDARGRLLGAADVDGDPYAAAHCPGTPLAAMASLDAEFGSGLSLVDIETMEVVARLDDEIPGMYELGVGRGDIACIDGGERVVIAADPSGGAGDRLVRMQSIDMTSTPPVVTDAVDGRGRGVVHPSGTVFLLPTTGDGRLRTAAPGSGTAADPGFVELGDGVSVKSGAVAPDGDRLALLVTLEGRDVDPYAIVSSHVMVLDVMDGVPVAGTERLIELPVERDATDFGQPEEITWLDDETWVVERRTGVGHWIDVMETDGSLVSSSAVDRGWGLLALDGSILRSPQAGLELVGRDGSTTDLVPAPAPVAPSLPFFLTSVTDGADLDVHLVPEVEPIVIQALGDPIEVAPVEVAPVEVAPVEVAPVEVETGATGSGAVGTGDSDTAEERQASSSDEGRSSMGLVIGIAVLLVILVVGLQAIKRQRDEGRRSKLPPIG